MSLALAIFPLFCCGCLGHFRDRPLSYRDYSGYHPTAMTSVATAGDGCADCGGSVAPQCSDAGCHSGGCDRCAGDTHVPLGGYHGLPLAHRVLNRLTCGDGCGEVYVGEWLSTPPTPDPCDFDGNYTGCDNGMTFHPHAQPVRSILRKLGGIRFLGTRYTHDWDAAHGWTPADPAAWMEPTGDLPLASDVPPLHTIAGPTTQPACNCSH
jgi:hypothetical protein